MVGSSLRLTSIKPLFLFKPENALLKLKLFNFTPLVPLSGYQIEFFIQL